MLLLSIVCAFEGSGVWVCKGQFGAKGHTMQVGGEAKGHGCK